MGINGIYSLYRFAAGRNRVAADDGSEGAVDRDTADGPVRDLLATLKQRKKTQFLDSRTMRKGRVRAIRCDGTHALEATAAQKKRVTALIDGYAAGTGRPGSFRVLDVARRIAGTGSLGVDRYLVLVEGDGGPAGNDLLDFKLAPRSSLAGLVKTRQPRWPSQAHRVVALHQRMQAAAPAFLGHVGSGKASYVLRELQPGEDRLALTDKDVSADDRESALRQMAQGGGVGASAQLRAAGLGHRRRPDRLRRRPQQVERRADRSCNAVRRPGRQGLAGLLQRL